MPVKAKPAQPELTESVNATIVLIGFMGSGKTTVGRILSDYDQCEIIDTDKWIEDKQKKSVAEIFAEEGEAFFRRLETELLTALKDAGKQIGILAVGGGLPLREENRLLMKQIGKVVYLKASAETIFRRLKEDTARPLLHVPDPQQKIREMLNERATVYEGVADFTIDTDSMTADQIADEILRINKISDLVDGLFDINDKSAYQCLRELETASVQSDVVYQFFDTFASMISNDNSYIRTRGLILISANAKWDKDNKIDEIIDKYLQHILDDKPITSRQCIKSLPPIAESKPDLAEIIIHALEKANPERYESSMQSLVMKDIRLALEKIKCSRKETT